MPPVRARFVHRTGHIVTAVYQCSALFFVSAAVACLEIHDVSELLSLHVPFQVLCADIYHLIQVSGR